MKWLLRILIGLAVAGTVAAGAMVIHDSGGTDTPAAAAASVDADGQVAGSGIVEASTGTIPVSTPVTGLIERMEVRWG